jgi:lysophospholipase L1-like esterase
VVVIEIGVNDADASYTAANAQRIIAAQGGARLLVWLTAHGPEAQVLAINEAIVAAMGPLSNGAVLDWNRLVPLDALSSDGIHPDAGQQGVLASILDPYLQGWLDAVRGTGATACERIIRGAA